MIDLSETLFFKSEFFKSGASNEMQMESFNKLTSTARQAYLARMKRLAECVPGREIRAGTRRIRTRQSGFTIKSSSSEQLSRFLQDPARTQLRLSVLRGSDRSKIVHLVRGFFWNVIQASPKTFVKSLLVKMQKKLKKHYLRGPSWIFATRIWKTT